jgi:hypothetical protein
MTQSIRILTIGAGQADLVSIRELFQANDEEILVASQNAHTVGELPGLQGMQEWDLLLVYSLLEQGSLDSILEITRQAETAVPIIVITD